MIGLKRLSRADFVRISHRRSRRIHGRFFSLVISSHLEDSEGISFACVVSKKVARRAVDRNLLKRRCRGAVRARRSGLIEPHALIFYAKRGAHEATYQKLAKDIGELIGKIHPPA